MSSKDTASEESETASIVSGIPGIMRNAFIVLTLIMSAVLNLDAAQLTITWDPPVLNTDGSVITDLAGYEVSYGRSPGAYATVIDVGNAEQATITSLSEGSDYYFSVQAYNTSGEVSDYSMEIAATINMPPVAMDDSALTDFEISVGIDVLSNDFDADSDILLIESVSTAANGTVIINVDNTIEYIPNPGFTGSDIFSYTITDGKGGMDTAGVTVDVNSTGPPEPPADPEYLWLEAESGNIVSPVTVSSDPDASGGSYIHSTSYNTGTASFSFNAAGGDYIIWALCSAGSPSPTAHNSFYVSMDGGVEDVWDLFYDVSPSPVIEWTWDHLSTRSGGTYNNNLGDPRVFRLTAGTHTLTLRGRETDTKLDRLLITSDTGFDPGAIPPPPQDPPVITVQPKDESVVEGDTALFTVEATGTGGLAYQWYRGTLPLLLATNSSYQLDATDFADDNGALFKASVSNPAGSVTSRTARLTVAAPNNPPTAVNDNVTCEANTSKEISPLDNDWDEDGDPFLISSITAPTYGSAVVNEGRTITYTPLPSFTGTDSILYTIADSRGDVSTAIILLSVDDNAAPLVLINYPTDEAEYTTTNPVLRIEGTASDSIGISSIRYDNNRSENDEIPGADAWVFDGIPLFSGENIITVTAVDEGGNSASDVLTVDYQSAYPRLDEAVLRAGMAIQYIQMPDQLEPGELVTVQWQVLSYMPLLSAMSVTLPDGSALTNVVMNGTRTGSIDGRWRIGDRNSKLYSFECTWVVPSAAGTCRVRFLCAEQDGYAYINANIPSGVDARPYGTDGKEIERDILVGIDTVEIETEELITAPNTFDSLENAVLRAGGTIESISIADSIAQGSEVVCSWDVLSYVPLRSRIRIELPNGDIEMAEARLVDEQAGRWKISTFQSRVYTFEYTWKVPDASGECRIRFLNARADGYGWMNGNIPGGADARPYGSDGKEIERTVKDVLYEQE